MKYRPLTIIAMLIIALCSTAPPQAAGGPARSPEEDYYRHRKRGDFAGAIESLRAWSAGLDDPAVITANLFRLGELLAYPELYGRAMRALDSMGPAARDPFARDLADLLRARLLLADGDTRGAEAILASLSFLDFQALGPLGREEAREAEAALFPVAGSDPGVPRGRSAAGTGWHPVSPDRCGVIDFNDLYPLSGSALFYLRRSFQAPRTGEYTILLGTSGFTDLWLDGARIFSDPAGHQFSHGQYCIRVSLPQGRHRLMVRAGGAGKGVRCSVRIMAADGTRIAAGDMTGAGGDNAGAGTLIAADYFPALAGLTGKSAPDDRYLAGYLFHAAGFRGAGGRAGGYLSSVPDGHPRRSPALFYLAMATDDAMSRDMLLRHSLQSDPGNLETMRELALLKIRRGFVYEAAPLAEVLRKAAPASPWHGELTARVFASTGPAAEALRRADDLEATPYASAGLRFGASIYLSEGDYFHARERLDRLVRLDRFDRESYLSLLECHEKTGDRVAAEALLLKLLHLYPNWIDLKLRCARVVEAGRGPGASLPGLTAALKTAPRNREVLRALGTAYHAMGNRGLALYYLDRAQDLDPGDRALRDYRSFIRGGSAPSRRKGAQ